MEFSAQEKYLMGVGRKDGISGMGKVWLGDLEAIRIVYRKFSKGFMLGDSRLGLG